MKVRALVIEDEQMVRTLIMRSLKRSGMADFEFVEAADGEQGLKAFQPDAIDLVLVDWHMPKMPGPEVCNRIRNTPGGQEVPIVMITSESGLGSMMVAADKGDVNAFITKPFTSNDLRHKIGPIIDDLAYRQRQAEKQGKSQGLLGRLFGS